MILEPADWHAQTGEVPPPARKSAKPPAHSSPAPPHRQAIFRCSSHTISLPWIKSPQSLGFPIRVDSRNSRLKTSAVQHSIWNWDVPGTPSAGEPASHLLVPRPSKCSLSRANIHDPSRQEVFVHQGAKSAGYAFNMPVDNTLGYPYWISSSVKTHSFPAQSITLLYKHFCSFINT